jgi:hypothetical protein
LSAPRSPAHACHGNSASVKPLWNKYNPTSLVRWAASRLDPAPV